jgi:hypothetical protein
MNETELQRKDAARDRAVCAIVRLAASGRMAEALGWIPELRRASLAVLEAEGALVGLGVLEPSETFRTSVENTRTIGYTLRAGSAAEPGSDRPA